MKMDKNQKFFPDFGYEAPRKTRRECPNPAFLNHNLHRIGIFKKYHSSDVDDGLPGWITKLMCVNCGKEFKGGYFHPGPKEVNHEY
jgi:hypothetical protein